MKKTALTITLFLLLSITLWAYNSDWVLDKSTLDNNETSYTINYAPNRGKPFLYSLAQIEKEFSIRVMLPLEKSELQDEIRAYYQNKMPKELKKALASSCNLHNPTLAPLRDNFDSAFKETALYKKLEKELLSKEYWIDKEIDFEKFHIYKNKKSYLFNADIWLKAIPFVELLESAKKTFPNRSEEEVKTILQNGFWSWDRGEVVVSIPNKNETTLYLFMKNQKGKYISVDISKVERINLGTIGLNPPFKKLESKAVEWMEDKEELVMVKIETMIWSRGKRYRRSEPLLVKRDGEVMWR